MLEKNSEKICAVFKEEMLSQKDEIVFYGKQRLYWDHEVMHLLSTVKLWVDLCKLEINTMWRLPIWPDANAMWKEPGLAEEACFLAILGEMNSLLAVVAAWCVPCSPQYFASMKEDEYSKKSYLRGIEDFFFFQ